MVQSPHSIHQIYSCSKRCFIPQTIIPNVTPSQFLFIFAKRASNSYQTQTKWEYLTGATFYLGNPPTMDNPLISPDHTSEHLNPLAFSFLDKKIRCQSDLFVDLKSPTVV